MLALDDMLITFYVSVGVTFVDVDMTQGNDLGWVDVSRVSELVGVEVYLEDVGEVLVLFVNIKLCQK
jgi:hypothetical protein